MDFDNPYSNFNSEQKVEKAQAKRKLYMKPYTIYSQKDNQLLTIRPRKAVYSYKDSGYYTCDRVGYLILKVRPFSLPLVNSNGRGRLRHNSVHTELWGS